MWLGDKLELTILYERCCALFGPASQALFKLVGDNISNIHFSGVDGLGFRMTYNVRHTFIWVLSSATNY
jgi:hypothetical protein